MNVDPAVALHESAHAVAAAALGIGVRVVRALPCEIPTLQASHVGGELTIQSVRTALAGATLLDDNARSAPAQHRFAVKVAGQLAEMLAGRTPAVEPEGEGDLSEAIRLIPQDVDAHAWAYEGIGVATRLLTDNLVPLAALVGAVMANAIVKGEELTALLSGVNEDVPRSVEIRS